MLASPQPSPLERRVTWWVAAPLDPEAMRLGASGLVGTYDFASFRASDCARRTTVRTLTRLEVTPSGEEIRFDVEGTAFLKNMVRIIVGTLVEVGRGRIPAEELAAIRDARDRRRAGPTAPPEGLTLVRVFYSS